MFGVCLWRVLDLTTTSTLCLFLPSAGPIRAENGRPVHFLTLVTAPIARSCIMFTPSQGRSSGSGHYTPSVKAALQRGDILVVNTKLGRDPITDHG